MVKTLKQHILIILFFISVIIFIMSAQAFAASFEASINRNEIAVGESFRLELSLSGASPKAAPDFSVLEKDFTIVSRGQSSQTTIINGAVSSSINWQLILIAPKDGHYTIPPVSIKTDAGQLKSNALAVTVSKTSALSSQFGTAQVPALSVTANVNKKAPYQNEPILYTVKLIAARNIGDVGIPEFEVPDAIIEKQGDAKVYDAKLQRGPVKVIEARYLITPLKSGLLKIPAFVFQGQIESAVQRQRQRSLFNDPFFGMRDPFSMFDNLNSYEPFAVASEEILLNVKAPAVLMDPWLPLSSLKISDHLEGADKAKAGEPLTLSLTMVAQGAVGSVLPSIESQITPSADFKIYADKPEIGESISDDGKSITGWREERYTLIPQKSGMLNLPEIKIPWWNVQENKIAYTIIPAKQINVAAGEISTKPASKPEKLLKKPPPLQKSAPVKEAKLIEPDIKQDADLTSYINTTLGIAVAFIAVLIGLVFYLLRKVSVQSRALKNTHPPILSPANEDKISFSTIKNAKTAEELKNTIQLFAHQHWNASRNASLMSIYALLKKKSPKAKKLFTDLDAALYAGDDDVDLETLKKNLHELLKSSNSDSDKVKQNKNQAPIKNINPS